MKKVIFGMAMLFLSLKAFGQVQLGDWNGQLAVGGTSLKIVYHVIQSGKTYSATMDSPDQGAFGIAMDETVIDGNHLEIGLKAAGMHFAGDWKNDTITGTFSQAGQQFPLQLTRATGSAKPPVHAQEPKAPFPYYVKEVEFENPKAGVKLAGTLTMPSKRGKYPFVILISGSGPQDRNEEILGHKPFLVLADFLTRNGFGVLRYDDRGVHKSTGNFEAATSFDFASDVQAAINYLKSNKHADPKRIGLMGHSEGGLIAPIVAADNPDVAFIVLLAGTGMKGADILLLQQELISRANGASEEDIQQNSRLYEKVYQMILEEEDSVKLEKQLTEYVSTVYDTLPESEQTETEEEMASELNKVFNSPWMRTFLRYDPVQSLHKVKCPVLAVNGSKDLQVPPKENLAAIDSALKESGNTRVTVHELEGLNHLFQECTTGSPNEYAKIDQTFSPDALKYILDWLSQFR